MVDAFTSEEGKLAPAVTVATVLIVAALALGIVYRTLVFVL